MKYLTLYFAYVLVPITFAMSMHGMLSPIQKEVLGYEIELNGVEAVEKKMLENPAMTSDGVNKLYANSVILTLKTDVYKTDIPDRLNQLVFGAVEKIEFNSWEHRYANGAMPYGDFKPLEQHVDYAWIGEGGERKAAVTVKVRYENKKAIDEILDTYRK